MATWKLPLLLLVGLSLLAVSATARPCKTLFFFTSTSYYPAHSSKPISNPNFSVSPRFMTFFVTTAPRIRDDGDRFRFNNPSIFLGRNAIFFDRVGENHHQRVVDVEEEDEAPVKRSMLPVELYSSVANSIRDRTKDIMQVMGAMLFGAGCGALTAAAMYLIWSLFWPTTYDFEDSDHEDDGGDDDISPKKMGGGYFVLPAKVVDDADDLKKPLTKEVV